MCINSKVHGLRSATIRPFNVAGPRQSRYGGFVMPTFVQQALEGLPMTVFASASSAAPSCRCSTSAGSSTSTSPTRRSTTRRSTTSATRATTTEIYELAVRIKEMTGSESDIIYADATKIYGPQYEEAESFEKLPELKNAAALGWSPGWTSTP